jgi:hypothetical protein
MKKGKAKDYAAADKKGGGKKTSKSDNKIVPKSAGHCSMPMMPLRPIDPQAMPNRERLIRVVDRKWVNNTVLRYCFLDKPARWRGSDADKEAVRKAFETWKGLPIGLTFREVADARQAEFRIGFDQRDGSWSYVGRDAIDHASDPASRTMNFGWPLTTAYGRDTALHEIGHALGFPHEHQNPIAGIVWNTEKVYEYFSGPPNNWDKATIDWNILRKLQAAEVDGSDWDPDSIMHYQFDAGLISEPEIYRTKPLIPASGLSATDISAAQHFYPAQKTAKLPELKPYEAHRIRIDPGQQLDFEIRPELSRDYTIQTFGQMDTVMVLFEEINGEPAYLDGDDDSGWDSNAKIVQRLFQGRKYFLRLRLYYAQASGEGALMMY